MLNQLRGRNLAHVGCTLGLVLGLTLGIVVGLAVSLLVRTSAGLDLATLAFFGLTFALGALGYYLGGRFSRRLEDATGAGSAEGPFADTSSVSQRFPPR
jgi:hypothetical protein